MTKIVNCLFWLPRTYGMELSVCINASFQFNTKCPRTPQRSAITSEQMSETSTQPRAEHSRDRQNFAYMKNIEVFETPVPRAEEDARDSYHRRERLPPCLHSQQEGTYSHFSHLTTKSDGLALHCWWVGTRLPDSVLNSLRLTDTFCLSDSPSWEGRTPGRGNFNGCSSSVNTLVEDMHTYFTLKWGWVKGTWQQLWLGSNDFFFFFLNYSTWLLLYPSQKLK